MLSQRSRLVSLKNKTTESPATNPYSRRVTTERVKEFTPLCAAASSNGALKTPLCLSERYLYHLVTRDEEKEQSRQRTRHGHKKHWDGVCFSRLFSCISFCFLHHFSVICSRSFFKDVSSMISFVVCGAVLPSSSFFCVVLSASPSFDGRYSLPLIFGRCCIEWSHVAIRFGCGASAVRWTCLLVLPLWWCCFHPLSLCWVVVRGFLLRARCCLRSSLFAVPFWVVLSSSSVFGWCCFHSSLGEGRRCCFSSSSFGLVLLWGVDRSIFRFVSCFDVFVWSCHLSFGFSLFLSFHVYHYAFVYIFIVHSIFTSSICGFCFMFSFMFFIFVSLFILFLFILVEAIFSCFLPSVLFVFLLLRKEKGGLSRALSCSSTCSVIGAERCCSFFTEQLRSNNFQSTR